MLPFFGSVMTKDWVHGFFHSPVRQILLQIVMRAVITAFPPAWTSSVGMLSTLADFPFFSESRLLCDGFVGCFVSVWGHLSTDGSPLIL